MPLILCAEREPTYGDQLKSRLAAEGWRVEAVQSREQALLSASNQAPHVVLVDSGLSGDRELVRQFSRRNGGPGVILLADASQDLSTLSIAEAEAILRKPIRPEELIETVRASLSRSKADDVEPVPSASKGRLYTSQDIFGDLPVLV